MCEPAGGAVNTKTCFPCAGVVIAFVHAAVLAGGGADPRVELAGGAFGAVSGIGISFGGGSPATPALCAAAAAIVLLILADSAVLAGSRTVTGLEAVELAGRAQRARGSHGLLGQGLEPAEMAFPAPAFATGRLEQAGEAIGAVGGGVNMAMPARFAEGADDCLGVRGIPARPAVPTIGPALGILEMSGDTLRAFPEATQPAWAVCANHRAEGTRRAARARRQGDLALAIR